MSVGVGFGYGDSPYSSGPTYLTNSRKKASQPKQPSPANATGPLWLTLKNIPSTNAPKKGIVDTIRDGVNRVKDGGYVGVDGRFYTKDTPGYGVIAARNPAGQQRQQESQGAQYPTFGKTLQDYLGAGGANMTNVPAAFRKTLQDYLGMQEYQPEVWAKDLLAAHDAYNDKMEHRGKIGNRALGVIYDQLGDNVSNLGDESVERYQSAIDRSTDRLTESQEAMQNLSENVRQSDDQRRAAILGDLMTGTSDVQAGSDSAIARGAQSTSSMQNNLIDNLTEKQQVVGDYFDRAESGAGFKGAEAQQALLADVNNVISENEQARLNTLANARNEARAAATTHYGTDYGQWQDERNAAIEQNNQAYQRALDAYNAEYGQFTDNRNFENTLAQQMYNQYADQQQRAMSLAGRQSQQPETSALNLVLQQGKAAGVPDDLLQAITMSTSRAASSGNMNAEALVADTMRRMGYDPEDTQMAAAWSLVPQLLQAYK